MQHCNGSSRTCLKCGLSSKGIFMGGFWDTWLRVTTYEFLYAKCKLFSSFLMGLDPTSKSND